MFRNGTVRVKVHEPIKDAVDVLLRVKRVKVVAESKTLQRIKAFDKTVRTPLPRYAKISVLRRFLRAFIPQIPAAVLAGIKADSFWVGFGLTVLGASGTALDKCLREKKRVRDAL